MMSNPKKEVIIPEGGAKPLAPYSPAIRLGGHLVFTSGQIGLDPATGKLVEGGIEAETRQALENLKALLKAGGAGIDSVVKATIYMADLDDYGKVNAIYGEYFKDDPPARSALEAVRLPIGALIEIEVIAFVKE
jgi:2-iminobutanoate/2-iminopropanoate deaminase